ncbi:MAG TPA: FtsW/RodA/SpoVE family cell cycle protein, partial [Candidatus Sulfotelmatobacter sp.]|nr:FtsW/RodA/SpoVE family cell cycle protein [Candidatus Sulfotelmatobacter sp.]
MNFDTRLLKHLDKLLVLAMVALTTIGIVVITSAARGYIGPEGASAFVNKQIVAAGVGLVLMILAMLFDYEEYARMHWVLYGLNCALLALVLALGKFTNGAQSWIPLGPLGQFQPSEFGKVMLILTLGNQLDKMERIESIWDLIVPGLHLAPLMVLLLLQPDLGTSLVFVVIAAAMIYMSGFSGWKLGLLGGGPIAAVVGWYYAHVKWKVSMWPLKEHQIERLQT